MRRNKLLAFSLLLMIIYNTGITNNVIASMSLRAQRSKLKQSETPAVTLQVRSKVEVDDKFVTLGDIATIQTKDEDLKKLLMAIKLCETPPPGRTFIYDRPYLRSILRQALATKESSHDTEKIVRDISLDSLSIEGAKIIQISTRSRKILPEEIIRKAKESIDQDQQENIIVEAFTQPRTVEIPPGEIELKVLKPNKIKKLGSITVSVQILVDKKPYTTIPILLKLSSPKSKLSENLAMTNKVGSTPLSFRRNTALGSRVIPSTKTNLVKPGDLVILTLKTKSIEIATLVKVLEKGAKGDLIRVMNVDSKKIVGAEVIDQKRVRPLIYLGEF